MKIPTVSLNALKTEYIHWSQKFQQEQAKTARLARRYMRLTKVYNPFSVDKDINDILKRYEKSFW